MDLHIAIKNIVETDGVEIVKDIRLVSILSDFRAFETIPATKYILRAVIADGYAQKLLTIGSWNSQSENLCNQFVSSTGFQNDYAYVVFRCLAYGLGWVNDVSQPNSKQLQCRQPLQTNQPVKKLTKKEQKEAFLLSKVVFLNDLKRETGVEITNMSFEMCYDNDHRCFCINYEVRGKIRNDDRDIYIAFYDKKNKIRKKEQLWCVYKEGQHGDFFIESDYFEMPMSINEIDRICIFLQ